MKPIKKGLSEVAPCCGSVISPRRHSHKSIKGQRQDCITKSCSGFRPKYSSRARELSLLPGCCVFASKYSKANKKPDKVVTSEPEAEIVRHEKSRFLLWNGVEYGIL